MISTSSKCHQWFFQITKFFKLQNLKGTRFNKKRWERKRKKNSEKHQNSDDNTIGMVGKISMRRIQRHKERSPTIIKINHTNGSETSEPRHFWKARMAHPVHGLWPFVVLLDLSLQDLFNVTGNVVIKALLWF
jgi:hypothetical protein